MKKLFLIFAITGVVAIDSANAQAIIDQGNCGANGNNLTWVLTDDSTLTINGSGAMANYESPNNNPPWRSYINSSKISYLVIGNSVSSIGNRAFAGCLYLTGTLTIPNSVITIGDGAFYQCSGLSGALNIPNSVTAIGTSAFEYCIGLTGALSISGSVTTIGYSAFGNCESLTSVSVNAANSRYSSKDGILYNKQQDTLIWCPGGKTGTITIPNSVITIAKELSAVAKTYQGH